MLHRHQQTKRPVGIIGRHATQVHAVEIPAFNENATEEHIAMPCGSEKLEFKIPCRKTTATLFSEIQALLEYTALQFDLADREFTHSHLANH
ncbi:hypothetical protein KKF61_01450 [Patescibacteria group bacterium]|nr:hypothetical protein [Patescibacteria group bacterium]